MGAMCNSQRNLEASSTTKAPSGQNTSGFSVDDVLEVVKKFTLRGNNGTKVQLMPGDRLIVTELGPYGCKVNKEDKSWEQSMWLYPKDHGKIKNTGICVGDLLVAKKKVTLRGAGVTKKLTPGDKVKVMEKAANGNFKVNGENEDWTAFCWLYAKKDLKKFDKFDPTAETKEATEAAPEIKEEPKEENKEETA